MNAVYMRIRENIARI